MTRREIVAVVLVAACLGALAGTIISGIAASLNTSAAFGGGANEIQWSSGVATFAAIAAGVLGYFARTCAAKRWCLRFGEHPVAGTLEKVCRHHHTLEHHEAVYQAHADVHNRSGRLAFGESHRRAG